MPDDPGSVEFIPSAEPADGATEPRRPSRPRSRRWELALAALVLGGLALWQSRSHSDPSPSSTSTPTPVISASSGADVLRDPARCPGEQTCSVTTRIPPEVLTALRDAVPGVRLRAASTVTAVGAGLWFREVTARSGDLKLIVDVFRPVSLAGSWPLAAFDPDHGLVLVRRHVGGFMIQVQADAPRAAMPAIATLKRLVTDPRLVQLG